MKIQSVVASKIIVTRPSVALTGISSFQDLLDEKDSLFADKSESELLSIYNKQNPKVDADSLNAFKALSKSEKRAKLVNELTVQIEFRQDYEREGGNSNLWLFMERDNIGDTSSGSKVYYQTATLGRVEGFKLTEGGNFTIKDKVVFLNQKTTSTPVIANGDVVSNPKRAGKGGNILTKVGKMLFLITELIISNKYSAEQLQEEEDENRMEMKHDGIIDADSVPSDERGDNGQRSSEYQSWLNKHYMAKEHFTSIK